MSVHLLNIADAAGEVACCRLVPELLRLQMSITRNISVVGLGYVGLPVAVCFGEHTPVVGFDISAARIAELEEGCDRTGEVSAEELAGTDVTFTTSIDVLAAANFHIVAVPTPIDDAKRPDLTPLLAASRTVGQALSKGDIVVYESTVYPGATEEECVPVLEQISGLRCGVDFHVGYSPERINPGDREHVFTNIVKVVAGQDASTLEIIAAIYETVVEAGVHRAPSIKVAEAAKVIENTQRDLNIALMNELAVIFNRMGLDTGDVLEAAGTKWNFLKFSPGLVGGHCIGVDPYYLTHKANMIGYNPQVILAGRRINDDMGRFVVDQAIKQLIRQGHIVRNCQTTVLGLSFKEDVPDLRNTRVVDIITALEDYGVNVQVHDPLVDRDEAKHEYGVDVKNWTELVPAHCVILAVAHRVFVEAGWQQLGALLAEGDSVVVDVKGVLDRTCVPDGVSLWRM